MAKLMENRPASEVDAEHRHARVAVVGSVIVLVLGLVAGLWLIQPSDSDEPASSQADETDEPAADIDLATWTRTAGTQCEQAAAEHPVLTKGTDARRDPENVEAVDAGVRDLTTRIRDLDLPSEPGDAARTSQIIGIGDEASQVWVSLTKDSDDADEKGDIGDAVARTEAYIAGLLDLGVTCSALN